MTWKRTMLSAATARNPSSARISRGPLSIGLATARMRERNDGDDAVSKRSFNDKIENSLLQVFDILDSCEPKRATGFYGAHYGAVFASCAPLNS